MISRAELAEMLADEEISDVGVMAMIVDPLAAIEALAADVGDGPDAEARREMLSELLDMVQRGDA